MDLSLKEVFGNIQRQIDSLEKRLQRMEENLNLSLAIQRNHLIRIKHGEELADELILQGRPYNDLTPQKSYEIFRNKDLDFIFIDVSQSKYTPPQIIEGSLKIPLEDLSKRLTEITSRTIPILIISEKGIRSILACEILVKKGFYNLNNVSGGHQFWPGHPGEEETPPEFP